MRGFGIAVISALLGVAIARPVLAQAEIGLDQLIEEALGANPEIARAAKRTDAAWAAVPQASALPDPSLNFGYKDVSERELEYGFRQELPFPGKLRLRGEVASKEAEQSRQEVAAVRRRTVAKVKSTYHELVATYRIVAILEQNRQILRDFESTARSRYGVGVGAQQDVLRAQTEVSRLLTRIAIQQQQQNSLQAELNRLINRSPTAPLGRPVPLPYRTMRATLEELSAAVEQTSPMVRGQVIAVERGDRALDLARREYFPDFEVDLSRMRDIDMRNNGYRVMLSVKVPLYFTSRQREGVREATALRGAAVHELQATRQEVLFQLKDSYLRAQRAEQLIGLLLNAVIPQAGLTLQSAQAGYGVGAVDFLTLLSSLLTLQENRVELEMETAEHAKARARIEEISGEEP